MRAGERAAPQHNFSQASVVYRQMILHHFTIIISLENIYLFVYGGDGDGMMVKRILSGMTCTETDSYV